MRGLFLVAALFMAACGNSNINEPLPPLQPAVVTGHTGGISLGVLDNPAGLGDGKYVDDGGKYVAQLAAFENQTRTHPSPFHIFVHYGDAFPVDSMNKIVAAGLTPMVTLYCDQSATLAQVLAGKDDAYLSKWFQAATTWGKPFIFRPYHEMNEANNTSCGTMNQGPLFIQAWHHIHVLGAEMNNAEWLWSPSIRIVMNGKTSTDAYLPSLSDVDLIGGDHYSVSTGGVYEGPLSTTFVPAWFAHYKPLGKPLVLAEFGVTQPYQTAYFADFATLAPTMGLAAAVYWDADGGAQSAHAGLKWSLSGPGALAWQAASVKLAASP